MSRLPCLLWRTLFRLWTARRRTRTFPWNFFSWPVLLGQGSEPDLDFVWNRCTGASSAKMRRIEIASPNEQDCCRPTQQKTQLQKVWQRSCNSWSRDVKGGANLKTIETEPSTDGFSWNQWAALQTLHHCARLATVGVWSLPAFVNDS